jgi:tRNA A-37 threonylcarbamoyl transferase component Bud32
MEDLKSDCLANVYGEDPADIPEWIWDELRLMITTLFEQEGIEYLDITPYNCIEKDGKVYLIDFGDAKYTSANEEVDWFLLEFMFGENSWNPDYK